MADDRPTPNPLSIQDTEALIGVTAVMTGEIMVGATDADLVRHLSRRLVATELLSPGPEGESPTAGQVAAAFEALVQRLRYALGEHDERRASRLPTRTHHMVRFADEAAARRFAAELDGLGSAPARVRDEGEQRWTVSALLPGLSPDPEFDQWRARLTRLASAAGGAYAGSGNSE